jgi:hypothetical protein
MKPSQLWSAQRPAPSAALAAALIVAGASLLVPGSAGAGAPKFFFQIQEVKAGPEVDAALKAYAGEALKAELASRPEWASDVGPSGESARPGTDRSALVAELKRRNLRGFDVTARIERFKKELKDPKPGGRLKQLAVNVRVTVFGTTIPDAKLAFSGDGESGTEADVSEKHLAADTESAAKDVIKDAIKQAVDQAVVKLSSAGKSGPGAAGHHKKSH